MMMLLNLLNLRDSSNPLVLRMTLTHHKHSIVMLGGDRSEILDI